MENVHPIVELALEHVEVEDGDERPVALTGEGERALQDALQSRAGQADLLLAVQALVALAMHLDVDRGGKAVASRLLEIAASADSHLGDLATDLAGAQEGLARTGRRRFAAFTGAPEAPRAAPHVDRRRTALRLTQIAVPARFR